MEEIKKQGAYAKVDDSFKNKYRQDDVKETLEEMYKGHCCYCESIVGTSSYGRIEHLKPKSLPAFYQCGSMSILWTKKVERLCYFFEFLILLLLWCQITDRAMDPFTVIPCFYVFKDCSASFL